MDSMVVAWMDDFVGGSNLDDPLTNNDVLELMNYGEQDEWCSSSSTNLSDHMLASFALSAYSPPPVDELDSLEQYISTSVVEDCGSDGSLLTGGDQMMFNQICDTSQLIQRRDDKYSRNYIPRNLKISLDEKMLRAMFLFKEWSEGGMLAQVWVPIKNGDQYILSTSEQPFLPDNTLSGYREVSRLFTFAAEPKPGSFLGLPGRVFNSKIPEWTSNVMYYSKAEYLRVQYAIDHEVRGSIALPVFEDDSDERSCCAVLELVTTKEKPDFDLEMENVCRALQVSLSFCI